MKIERSIVNGICTLGLVILIVIWALIISSNSVEGDAIKTFEVNNQSEPIEYSFTNNKNYKALSYTSSISSGDFKLLVVNDQNEITYESAWHQDMRINNNSNNFQHSLYGDKANSTIIPMGNYKIRFLFKENTNAKINLKWAR